MKRIIYSLLAISIMACTSQNQSEKETESQWTQLFNGKDLSGWDTYIGADSLGLNNDPNHVFSVAQVDDESVLRISGQQFAGISTTQEFENFHLQLQFRWGELKWPPRENSKRDSGVLYFAGGKHGVDANAWMRSQEFQVQEGDTGDYWGVAGGAFQIPVKWDGENYVYDPSGEMMPFSTISEYGRHAVKNPDGENPTGQWNTIDLYCLGSTAVHMINGKIVMVLYNSGMVQGDALVPLTKGKIQIQSEGAEVFYKNIKVENITALPEGVATL